MNTSIDQDHEIRLVAFIRCARLMHDFGGAVPWGAIQEGFEFDGEHVYLAGKANTPIPGSGLPDAVVSQFASEAASSGTTQRIDLRWETLDRQELFRVDQDNGCLLLNQQYRDPILAGLPPFRSAALSADGERSQLGSSPVSR